MAHEPSSPMLSIDMGGRKWFDGWRIVTVVLTVLFLAGSVVSFSEVDDEKRWVAECEAEGRDDCGDWDLSDGFTVVGLYFLAVASCFGLATLADHGSGVRRASTVIGGLAFPPALAALMVIALLAVLLGRVISLIRRIVRQSLPAVSGEMPRGSR